jgi:lipopolysaccharide/colanic/teichoic acid biosynthesis glycosyltransferase
MPFRPGITGAATLAFRREEEILSAVHPSQLEHFYSRQIMPLKARLDLDYMGSATFSSDLRMLTATLLACLHLEEDLTASIWPSGAIESAQAGPQEETSMTA